MPGKKNRGTIKVVCGDQEEVKVAAPKPAQPKDVTPTNVDAPPKVAETSKVAA